jgi:hypothetical protein
MVVPFNACVKTPIISLSFCHSFLTSFWNKCYGNGLGFVCHSLCHVGNSRDNFSTTTRTEGWLEVWGENEAVGDDDECWQDEMDAAARFVM